MPRLFIRIVLILLLFVFLRPPGFANFYFSHLGVENGLSQISVLHIFQDSDGFLWFGTRNGVNVYDGYEFKVISNEVNNLNSLSDGYIRGIKEDKDKNIWVATNNGLNLINRKTKKITRFYPKDIIGGNVSNSITKLLSHSDGNLYAFSGKAVFLCKPAGGVAYLQTLDEITSSVLDVYQAEDGDIYISTYSSELYVFSEDWKLRKNIQLNDLGIGSYITAFLDKGGILYAATEDDGLFLFEKESLEIVSSYNKTNSSLSNNSIRSLLFLNKDTLLLGTFGGINMLSLETNRISPMKMNLQQEGGLNHYSIHSMLLDNAQTLWVGTYSAGINYSSPNFVPVTVISSEVFTGILGKGDEDKDGNIWFATEGAGLLFYNPVTKERKNYPIKPLTEENYEINIIKSVLVQGDSILCSTHFGSVFLFSIKNREFKLLYDFKMNDIYSMLIDSKNRLWIPTFSSRKLVMVDEGRLTNRFELAGNKEREFANITCLQELAPDKFLLGSYSDSIYLYDMKRGTVDNVALRIKKPHKQERLGEITAIVKDPAGIWVSTTKGGLVRFDHSLNFVKRYTREDGLSGSYLSSIILDKYNSLWVVADKDIFQLDRAQDRFHSMKLNEVVSKEFTLFAGFASSEGTVYFPANSAVLAFDPRQLKRNPVPPPVRIIEVLTLDQERIPLNRPGNESGNHYSVALNSMQNSFVIRFAALNYVHPEANKYMYMMEGIDSDWRDINNKREIHFSHLNPGEYTFRVKASNNEGVWNQEGAVLSITIAPPSYKTWWAYSLYVLFSLWVLFKIIRYNTKKKELERNLRFEQKEQESIRKLHEERMRMYTNFSHELRTPLSLILNPLNDMLQRVSFSPEVKKNLDMMRQNTQRLLSLVNNLMDVHKYEADKVELKTERIDFSAFLNQIYETFLPLAKQRDISFEIRNELPESYFVCFDMAEIEKVFFNLLSNAFKYTSSSGYVTISVRLLTKVENNKWSPSPLSATQASAGDRFLEIRVSDAGDGFTPEEAEKIFEPFYRIAGAHQQSIPGTGIGLHLVRSIISRHQGTITAGRNKDGGAEFILLLPDTEVQDDQPERADVDATLAGKIRKPEPSLLLEMERTKRKTALLVDDNPEILSYLEEQLTPDYIILKAPNGRKALEIVENSPVDIVISDVVMPVMNGIEFSKEMKLNPRTSHIPVILLTGKSMVSQIKEGLESGADDYIVKPFDVNILKIRIKNLLTSYESLKSLFAKPDSLKLFGIDEAGKENKFLSQYMEIVKSNISDPDLDVSLIYESLGMSRASFYRKLKDITSLSPVELIRNIRLEAAEKLLRESSMNVTEISQSVGFKSRSYFAKSFKSVYGVSPTEYQNGRQV